jgi:hypothetical protein
MRSGSGRDAGSVDTGGADADCTLGAAFRGLVEVIERHGLFLELYTDRASYFVTPEPGSKVSKIQLTRWVGP